MENLMSMALQENRGRYGASWVSALFMPTARRSGLRYRLWADATTRLEALSQKILEDPMWRQRIECRPLTREGIDLVRSKKVPSQRIRLGCESVNNAGLARIAANWQAQYNNPWPRRLNINSVTRPLNHVCFPQLLSRNDGGDRQHCLRV